MGLLELYSQSMFENKYLSQSLVCESHLSHKRSSGNTALTVPTRSSIMARSRPSIGERNRFGQDVGTYR